MHNTKKVAIFASLIFKRMGVSDILKIFSERPYTLRMGNRRLASWLKCEEADVREARSIYRAGESKWPNIKERRESGRFPKVLILDIETSPMLAYVYGLWRQNIAWNHVEKNWYVICWSAKWLYEGDIMSDCVTGDEALREDDSRILKGMWKLLDEADIVVAHNALGADLPWLNTRFLMNGFNPPKPYHVIDTLKVVRRQFGFASNKLDALCGYLGIPHKDPTNFDLWRKCISGDEEALKYMVKYNKQDVKILEDLYIALLPWIPGHPNMGNIMSDNICTMCGNGDLEELLGRYYYTGVGKYKLYRCTHCGGIVRGRENLNKDFKVNFMNINR